MHLEPPHNGLAASGRGRGRQQRLFEGVEASKGGGGGVGGQIVGAPQQPAVHKGGAPLVRQARRHQRLEEGGVVEEGEDVELQKYVVTKALCCECLWLTSWLAKREYLAARAAGDSAGQPVMKDQSPSRACDTSWRPEAPAKAAIKPAARSREPNTPTLVYAAAADSCTDAPGSPSTLMRDCCCTGTKAAPSPEVVLAGCGDASGRRGTTRPSEPPSSDSGACVKATSSPSTAATVRCTSPQPGSARSPSCASGMRRAPVAASGTKLVSTGAADGRKSRTLPTASIE